MGYQKFITIKGNSNAKGMLCLQAYYHIMFSNQQLQNPEFEVRIFQQGDRASSSVKVLKQHSDIRKDI